MSNQDGRLPTAPGYSASPEPVVSALRASIPSALDGMRLDTEKFLAECRAKEIKFSEPNPAFWRELHERANPQTLTVCKHLESEQSDAACRCSYPGSVWADPERVLFTMGDQWGDSAFRTERVPRASGIATAQLLTCLYNNADWLIGLAAQAIEARSGETRTRLDPQDESAVGSADASELNRHHTSPEGKEA